jgi:hypothetical protein
MKFNNFWTLLLHFFKTFSFGFSLIKESKQNSSPYSCPTACKMIYTKKEGWEVVLGESREEEESRPL